jgi:predicted nucleotidyltransferase
MTRRCPKANLISTLFHQKSDEPQAGDLLNIEPFGPAGYNARMSELDEQLNRLLSRYSNFKLIILFGSQATGHASADSDIDLALWADEPMSSSLKLELIEAIGSRFGCPADIVDLYEAPEPILGQVLKGRRILGDNPTYARLLTKHLINKADFVPLQDRILAERQRTWTR